MQRTKNQKVLVIIVTLVAFVVLIALLYVLLFYRPPEFRDFLERGEWLATNTTDEEETVWEIDGIRTVVVKQDQYNLWNWQLQHYVGRCYYTEDSGDTWYYPIRRPGLYFNEYLIRITTSGKASLWIIKSFAATAL